MNKVEKRVQYSLKEKNVTTAISRKLLNTHQNHIYRILRGTSMSYALTAIDIIQYVELFVEKLRYKIMCSVGLTSW